MKWGGRDAPERPQLTVLAFMLQWVIEDVSIIAE